MIFITQLHHEENVFNFNLNNVTIQQINIKIFIFISLEYVQDMTFFLSQDFPLNVPKLPKLNKKENTVRV